MSVEHHGSVFDPNTQKQLSQETKGNNISGAIKVIQIFHALRDSAHLRKREGFTQTIFSDREQDIMAILHGEHAKKLGDKSRFPGLVREMGYKAADSYLIRTDEIPRHERGQKALDYFQNPERVTEGNYIAKLFVKPLNGTWQRDLAEFDMTVEEGKDALIEYLANVHEYTLVQEFMPHEKWLRYMRYQNKNGQVYVACFEFSEDESPTSKRVKVPFGKVQNKPTGVSRNEYYTSIFNTSAIPLANDDNQLANLNTFMDKFSEDLETKLGGAAPLLSVDLGISDMKQLGGNYDPERMKNAVAFFETQGTPQQWDVNRLHLWTFCINTLPVKSYRDFWKAFMQDHGKDVVVRAKALRKSRS